jgi:hypothetical protein
MKITLYKPIVGALLAAGLFLTGSAGAATTLSIASPGNATFGMTHDPGSFMDDYTFSVTGALNEWATVGVLPGTTTDGISHMANYAINDLTFYKINGDNSHTLLMTTSSNIPGLLYYPTMSLAAGQYGFTLVGTTTIAGQGGAYSGTLNLAAVPEPAGFAMLGIGLGLLGFAARRQPNDKLG